MTAVPANRFDLQYLAPAGCPSRGEFLEWTNGFYSGAGEGLPDGDWQASEGDLAGSVRVKLVASGNAYSAHLVMVNADGQCATSRPPHTETTCTDAARAMAYSLAQALKEPPCSSGSVPADTPSAPSPPTPCPAAAPSAAREPAKPCPRPMPAPDTAPRWRGELGAGAGAIYPFADDFAIGGALLVGFRGMSRDPSARLTVGYYRTGRVPIGHELSAQLWTLGVAVCPVEVQLTGDFTLPLCAAAEVGPVALSGVGSAQAGDATGPNSEDRANLYLWSSLGVSPRLRLQRGWIFLEVEPSLVFPLLRHPIYVHQPSNQSSQRQRAGQLGRWMAGKAHLNAGFVFP